MRAKTFVKIVLLNLSEVFQDSKRYNDHDIEINASFGSSNFIDFQLDFGNLTIDIKGLKNRLKQSC